MFNFAGSKEVTPTTTSLVSLWFSLRDFPWQWLHPNGIILLHMSLLGGGGRGSLFGVKHACCVYLCVWWRGLMHVKGIM